jgi:predicted metal-dependent peptidase
VIKESSFTSKEALRLVNDAIFDLVLRAELMGLSLMGESIKILQDDSIQTMCTDGRNIRVSHKWLVKNGLRGNVFDLLHEWLHCFGNHVARRGSRDPKLWNRACDMWVVSAASEILSRPGDDWPPPRDGVQPAAWAQNLSVEEIYDRLKKEADQQSQNGRSAPGPLQASSLPKSGQPDDSNEIQDSSDFDYEGAENFTEEEDQEFISEFTNELAQAQLIMEMSSGKTVEGKYGSKVASRLSDVLKGTVPWGKLLRGDLIDKIEKRHATWSPPKRKYYPFIPLPTYQSTKTKKLVLPIDVSASVGEKMMKSFIANAMPAAMRADETIIITFDQVIREVVHTRRPQDILKQVKFLSGSHSYTDVRPVFDLVRTLNPSAVAILTDAYLSYPDEPYHEALFVVPRGAGKPPWGKTYIMEESW